MIVNGQNFSIHELFTCLVSSSFVLILTSPRWFPHKPHTSIRLHVHVCMFTCLTWNKCACDVCSVALCASHAITVATQVWRKDYISSRGAVWAVSAVIAHVLQAMCELCFDKRLTGPAVPAHAVYVCCVCVNDCPCYKHTCLSLIYVSDMEFLDERFMIYICHNKNISPKKVIHFSKKGMLAKLAVTCGFFEWATRPTRQGITSDGRGGRG